MKRKLFSKSDLLTAIALGFLMSAFSGLALAESAASVEKESKTGTDLLMPSGKPKHKSNGVTRNVVAPNINLKEVAPLPQVLLDTGSTSKKNIPDSLASENTELDAEKLEASDLPRKALAAPTPSAVITPEKLEGVDGIDDADTQDIHSASAITDADTTSSNKSPEPFVMLGAEVPPGTSTRLGWVPGIAIAGLATPVPVLVINGEEAGKTFCLTAAIHGDELNGIEVVRRVIYEIDPKKLKGRVIGVPIVNLQGFQRHSRYLADRRDLNRFFPGSSQGSLASRIAYSLFNEVVMHCDALIDLHTGSLRRTNLPQIRADMGNPQAVEFTESFDDMVVVHSPGKEGMLRWAAAEQNIPAVTLEIGESNRLQEEQVEIGVKSINGLLDRMGMYDRLFSWGDPEPVYYQSTWVRAELGGILFSVVELGDNVSKGDTLGNVTDPITNEVSSIIAPEEGRIIGMTVNQVVMPGFAAYHLGIEASEEEVSIEAHQQKPTIDFRNDTVE